MRREWLEKDYYATLGVAKEAADKDIRKAYRKLAQQYHPDANPGDAAAEERFKEINEAYRVLGDAEQRRQYDETRELGPFVGGPGGTHHVRIEDITGLFGDDSPFSFLGGDLFGGRRRPAAPSRGRDLTTDVSLTFHEAFNGVTTEVAANGRTAKVKIPAGVGDGARIRVKGRGEPGANGGPRGDLYVRVHVAGHPLFRRDGDDLRLELPVTFTEAALGAEIPVPTLDGKVTLRLPAGTTSGKTFRVRGQGFTRADGGRGDLLVVVEVEVPSDLTEDEQRILNDLREHEKERNPRSHLGV